MATRCRKIFCSLAAAIAVLLALVASVELVSPGERHSFCDALDSNLPSMAHCRRQGSRSAGHLRTPRVKLREEEFATQGRTKSLRLPLKHRDHFLATHFPDMAPPTHSERIKAAVQRDDWRVLHIHQTIQSRRETRRELKQIRRFHYDPTPPPPPNYASFEGGFVSGLSLGSGEYFLEISIGTPGHQTALIVDTGSDLTWLQCEPCNVCFSQIGTPFSPASSSSFEPLDCAAPECGYVDRPEGAVCSPKHPATCTYVYSYGDHSNTTGDLAYEAFTLSETGANGTTDQIAPVLFGCGHRNQGLFRGGSGLLALGQGSMSWASQVGSLYGNRFSYCMVDRGSSLLVASTLVFGLDPELDDQSLQWTPILSLPTIGTYYYVQVDGVTIGDQGVLLPVGVWDLTADGRGGTIVDSGTTLSYLAEPAATLVREEFLKQMPFPRAESADDVLDFCFDVGVNKSWREGVPKVTLSFAGGAEMLLPVDNYMILADGDKPDIVCLAVMSLPPSSTSILGNILQQNFHMVYDRGNYRLGFATDGTRSSMRVESYVVYLPTANGLDGTSAVVSSYSGKGCWENCHGESYTPVNPSWDIEEPRGRQHSMFGGQTVNCGVSATRKTESCTRWRDGDSLGGCRLVFLVRIT